MSRLLSDIKQQQGFTLIELVVTMAIIGLLSAIAVPTYQQYRIRGNRAAAQAQMMYIAILEKQYLFVKGNYADKTTLESNGYALTSDVSSNYSYDIAVGAGSVPTFTITFTPTGSQTNDGALTLDNDGVKTPSDKW